MIKLIRFEYPIEGQQQSKAWSFAIDLSRARGLPIPPTRYRHTKLSVKIHPDDRNALAGYCDFLTRAK